MKTTFLLLVAWAALQLGPRADGQTTALTYQGRLQHGGNAANGLYEISFALHDAVTNGSLVGVAVTVAPVEVSNGMFSATLDFGAAAFMGADRWLEITVTPFGSDQPPVTLVPRQPLTPAPYALHAHNAANLMSFANAPLDLRVNGMRALRLEATEGAPNLIGGSSSNAAEGGIAGATIAGGNGNRAGANFSSIGGGRDNAIELYVNHGEDPESTDDAVIGGGRGNLIQSGAFASTISGGSNNAIETNASLSTIAGGLANVIGPRAAESAIGGGDGNRVGDAAYHSTIAGGRGNVVEPGAIRGTIAGGYFNTIRTNAAHAVIGGGQNNTNDNDYATVGGGGLNRATGFGSVVAGGGGVQFDDGNEPRGNMASGDWSAVGGGADNVARGLFGVIGGGEANLVSGNYGMIPGGLDCLAEGQLSFAAGSGAHALHDGSFVWSGHGPPLGGPPFESTANDQFSARAAGGVRFFTDFAATTGAVLAPGSGTWSSLSDRAAKENFAAVNAREILDKVAALPLVSWNYKAQDESVRHLGPMAQDFHAAFGLGESDRTITTVDADGVALAAIQGLNQKLAQALTAKAAEVQQLESANAALEARVAALEQVVNSLASRLADEPTAGGQPRSFSRLKVDQRMLPGACFLREAPERASGSDRRAGKGSWFTGRR